VIKALYALVFALHNANMMKFYAQASLTLVMDALQKKFAVQNTKILMVKTVQIIQLLISVQKCATKMKLYSEVQTIKFYVLHMKTHLDVSLRHNVYTVV
jgi:hypothetical protein